MIRSCVGLSSFKALGGLAAVLLAVPSLGAVITFDDIPAETLYVDGDVITSNGINIIVTGEGNGPRLRASPGGIETEPVVAKVLSRKVFGETTDGNLLALRNNTLAQFVLPGVLDGFSLEYGSEMLLSLNGETKFVSLTHGGAEIGGIQVSSVFDGDTLLLFGVGEIHSFEIQSFGGGVSVDNVILSQPIPEPGSLSLILIGGGVLTRRRRG